MNENMNRRQFLSTTAIAGAGVSFTLSQVARAQNAGLASGADSGGKPALLGGKPVRTKPPHRWPVIDEREDKAMLETVRSGKWFRGSGPNVTHFEQAYAKATGAKNCVATNSGTSALFTSLNAVGVSAGDEVIVAPYTFIATVTVILLHHALPIFVDTDPETFQIDARKIEAAITDRTTAIVPVHLGGSAADLDTILAVAKQHKLPVVEDACQSHLGEWHGRKLGTWGDTGCFSFQASKNLNCGDGGAIITNSDEWADQCYSFHNQCRPRRTSSREAVATSSRGGNFRMTEFQAAILLAQMTRLEDQMQTREQNADYLRGLLKEIPGIVPAKMYDNCSRNAYHLFMYRYQKEHFGGLPRKRFLEALRAEGVDCNAGYGMLNKEAFIKNSLASRSWQRLFPAEALAKWEERTACPANDKLSEEAAWFTQTTLLGPRSDMDQMAEAIRKIQKHAGDLAGGTPLHAPRPGPVTRGLT
jgi:dTDP-4-amino-4,6-dideoxygalactose transaminase